MTPEELETLMAMMTPTEREALLRVLRDQYGVPIHTLEAQWNTTAETILEAIQRASDLVQRGVRGIIAEATFRTVVLPKSLPKWRELPIQGDQAYDLLLEDGGGPVRVQVKMQRRRDGRPMQYKKRSDTFVVETQRTRSGKRSDSEPSRPYRVSEFDLLAVCLHPSTGRWTDFLYCAARDLLTRSHDPKLLEVMQPIPIAGSQHWNPDFEQVVARFRL